MVTFSTGEHVDVLVGDTWYPGTIKDQQGWLDEKPGQYRLYMPYLFTSEVVVTVPIDCIKAIPFEEEMRRSFSHGDLLHAVQDCQPPRSRVHRIFDSPWYARFAWAFYGMGIGVWFVPLVRWIHRH
jgi:hypothetical protein